jgi:flagellar biosynthetic protein FliQ
MNELDVIRIGRESVWVAIQLGGPMLAAAMAIGLVVALFQALTQINEATLTFVPKVLAVAAVAVLSAPFMVATLDGFARELFDRMIAVGLGEGGGG